VPAVAEGPDPQQLVVDLGDRTGEFRGAASGVLYGLSDDGVPSDNTLEPLRMTTVNQKPPAGAQHPNGDALVVADSFFRTGGEYIQVNVQDMYANWTYENLGFDDYMEKLAWVVEQVSQSPYADRIVYVPFNEPDYIWYGLSTGNPALYEQRMATFLDHWKTSVEYIREHHEGARVMGTNDAIFRARNYGDFLSFARDNDVLPDYVSWHQLDSSSMNPSNANYFRNTYQVYRALEQERGIDPIQININEYGGNRDLTVPGQLVQWVAMFEEAKVDAGGKAYWTAAGGLAGDVVQTNKPGGGWWFYKMYADMAGGDTVAVTRPDTTSLDALDAIAVIDDERRQARIVAGGTADLHPAALESHAELPGSTPAVFGPAGRGVIQAMVDVNGNNIAQFPGQQAGEQRKQNGGIPATGEGDDPSPCRAQIGDPCGDQLFQGLLGFHGVCPAGQAFRPVAGKRLIPCIGRRTSAAGNGAPSARPSASGRAGTGPRSGCAEWFPRPCPSRGERRRGVPRAPGQSDPGS
jgi:hypothetical protein